MVDAQVHLPGGVVGEVEPVSGFAGRNLVEATVAQPYRGHGGHDVERGVLGLVGEEAPSLSLGLRNVLRALVHVGSRGVLGQTNDQQQQRENASLQVHLRKTTLRVAA